MSLELSMELKNSMLNQAFRVSGSDGKIWLSIDIVEGGNTTRKNLEVKFDTAVDGSIGLKNPATFIVEPSVSAVVNKVYINDAESYGIQGQTRLGNIVLTGDDIVTFNDVGAFIISQLTINLTEVS